ncbi:MAG: 1,4-alpha-glucan branching protein GlgB [Proteobacteria bacterium]|jgi:1,4-alpha-glucan branching enzyme|nr:1,4-alpha-glucan branching protein GlgB [Desulfocapsa sp.]MBU3943396.1 1,4-alpha-glucan branching protein GlgB [Pseudomonadota bacterium]MCG2744679.1 1,4-alpha-glucan branching protein GlgB [Desulfobacteraceae bacterium]MBU4030014.1 1,4-alpha-glucan branching protein GlgB [Pseudomonadota bacterium]MBU4041881.1 1,4-alpha-glucan branching protein GlgB [Pseudomonadota bacterium]
MNEIKEQLDKIIHATHHDPFQFLGVHFSGSEEQTVVIRTFQPHAASVTLLTETFSLPMKKTCDEGLYELELERATFKDIDLDPYNYRFEITYFDGTVHTVNDPYRFLPALDEQDRYLFNFGTHYELYNHMGAHMTSRSGIAGTIFRVWAPSAARVSVLGNFNSWDGRVHAMRSLGGSGIWELFLPGIGEDELYKFEIRTQQGAILEKNDPFQFYGELRPKTASIVRPLDHYTWEDQQWQQDRNVISPYDQPMAIYEAHPGSWQRDPEDPERFLTFRELADKLIPYVQKLGFTHIELMPVMEHPLDESWGYQVTGPFSMTSRYGTPEDFMYFVDQCHQNKIGVILDWVPAHFPKDEHSLGRFDGTSLFEHEDPRKGEQQEWGTFIYNYGRREVSNFLIANALFWLDKYHIDGLRVDAVASMLYLDYSRKEGEWIPNAYGGRENLEAIEFIRHLNSIIYDRHPNTLMIAEESTSFYGVSKAADIGGLGFGFKWNMGWMNDILSYFTKDPLYRKFHHNILTFSIIYAFSENFILPMSHDEVVHGKRSLLDKMPGDLWQKFANLRLLFLTMWMHPGKKLLFMGSEFGQWAEWNCKRSLDFHLLDENPLHSQMLTFVAELNRFYKENPSLWQLDFSPEGFQWLDLEDRQNSIISYVRYGKNRADHLVCLFNYTPQTHYDYKLGLPTDSQYEAIFCSDSEKFGGSNAGNNESNTTIYQPLAEPFAQAPFHTRITVPPLAGVILRPISR